MPRRQEDEHFSMCEDGGDDPSKCYTMDLSAQAKEPEL